MVRTRTGGNVLLAAAAILFFGGLWLCFQLGVYDPAIHDRAALQRGWGVPKSSLRSTDQRRAPSDALRA